MDVEQNGLQNMYLPWNLERNPTMAIGRTSRLGEAEELVQWMQVQNIVSWRGLLGITKLFAFSLVLLLITHVQVVVDLVVMYH